MTGIHTYKLPDLVLLNAGRAIHNADWNWKGVSSPFSRIYYVESGNARLHLSDRVYDLVPGFLYLIPPFTVHGYECNGHFILYYIHLYELQSYRMLLMD